MFGEREPPFKPRELPLVKVAPPSLRNYLHLQIYMGLRNPLWRLRDTYILPIVNG